MDAFGISKTSKSKVLAKLSSWEKDSKSAYIGISIRKKVIDGVTKTMMCIDRNGPGSNNIPVEFSDREEFKKELDKVIDGIEKQL